MNNEHNDSQSKDENSYSNNHNTILTDYMEGDVESINHDSRKSSNKMKTSESNRQYFQLNPQRLNHVIEYMASLKRYNMHMIMRRMARGSQLTKDLEIINSSPLFTGTFES